MVLRVSVREAALRALIASQFGIFLLASLGAGDGDGGGGSSQPIDVRALVVFLAVLYIDLSVLLFALCYAFIRRYAVRLSPEGLGVGKRLTPWSTIVGIDTVARKRAPLVRVQAGPRVKTVKLPLPWRGPRGRATFDQQLNLVRAYWQAHVPFLGESDGGTVVEGARVPFLGEGDSGPVVEDEDAGSPHGGRPLTSGPARRSEALVAAGVVTAVVGAATLSFFALVGTTTTEMIPTCTTSVAGVITDANRDVQIVARHRLFLPTRYETRNPAGGWWGVPSAPPGSCLS